VLPRPRFPTLLAASLGLVLFLLAWYLASLRYIAMILPSPLETWHALMRIWESGALADAALATATSALGGFALASLIGAALGVLAGLHPFVRNALWPVVSIVQGIPHIAWVVLALIWFGSGGATVFTVVIVTFPFAFVGALEGVRSSDAGLIEMARAFRAPATQVLTDLYAPQLVSYLFPSLVTGLALGWKVAVMAELLGGAGGIGAGLAVARTNLDTAAMLAWIATLVAMLFAFEYLVLHPLKRRLEPWRQEPAPTLAS
jgi:NitT/TauT family transport system permease protein